MHPNFTCRTRTDPDKSLALSLFFSLSRSLALALSDKADLGRNVDGNAAVHPHQHTSAYISIRQHTCGGAILTVMQRSIHIVGGQAFVDASHFVYGIV